MTCNARIELASSKTEWPAIRECFVNSFRRYPLYKYMVPHPTIRDAFLRAYLDANYDVTVGSGEGILLGVKVPENGEDKVVGGVLFVPPSSDGCGWAIGSHEPYWKAYDKHGLAKISPEGLERVIRYEAWENNHVTKKLARTRVPMWNGLFCAICPEYASKGCGSAVYKGAIAIMSEHWSNRRKAAGNRAPVSRKATEISDVLAQDPDDFMGRFGAKLLHGFSLLNHRSLPSGIALAQRKPPTSEASKSHRAPLLAAVSHSDRAANFHTANGFRMVSRLPYHDDVEDVTPFFAHVLVLDPFKTGRLENCNDDLKVRLSQALAEPTDGRETLHVK